MLGLAFLWALYGLITLILELINAPELPKTLKIVATIYFICLGPFARPSINLVLGILNKG